MHVPLPPVVCRQILYYFYLLHASFRRTQRKVVFTSTRFINRTRARIIPDEENNQPCICCGISAHAGKQQRLLRLSIRASAFVKRDPMGKIVSRGYSYYRSFASRRHSRQVVRSVVGENFLRVFQELLG